MNGRDHRAPNPCLAERLMELADVATHASDSLQSEDVVREHGPDLITREVPASPPMLSVPAMVGHTAADHCTRPFDSETHPNGCTVEIRRPFSLFCVVRKFQ